MAGHCAGPAKPDFPREAGSLLAVQSKNQRHSSVVAVG
jgi:hypothetical protein